MNMLFSLFISMIAVLLGAASAYPTEDLVAQVPNNTTKHPWNFYDSSIQILLNRASGTEYWWEMFQGPFGQAVQPCTYPDPFKFASMKGPYQYGRDAIDNPPSAPAMDLKLLEWMGHDDCMWRTHGNGDVGELICGGWMVMPCEQDAEYHKGVINCNGRSYHRMYACRY